MAERKLHRAEALLRLCFPNLNLDDPRLDTLIQKGALPGPNQNASAKRIQDSLFPASAEKQSSVPDSTTDSNLESMVRATGQLDVDDCGHWDYYGHSSGLNFLRRMGEEFGSVARPDLLGDKALKSSRLKQQQSNGATSSPRSPHDTFSEATLADELPPRELALELCRNALEDAACIMCCVHQPSFYQSLDRIYERSFESYDNEDHRFLPLLYTAMALGCLFARGEQSKLERKGYPSATDEG